IVKEGNPFQQFWDELGVDFDGYMSHHLSFDVEDPYTKKEWELEFPPSSFPVLALRGAPARFPVNEDHRHIQRYLKWSPLLLKQARKLISELLPKGPFVGIHLRNGLDWENACMHVEGLPNFMASPQCLGYSQYRKLNKEICFPSKVEMLNRTKATVERIKASAVYVATDNEPMLSDLKATLLEYKTHVVHANPPLPQIDLIILAKSDFFIGNCVSSFTAHVKRERDVNGLPSSFWGYTEK
ncbi:GDP-fucose protein O-fucosyltransferase 1-like, partial [Actinia tenebrosa]|uniref:GDP-fucose protein O-fucosyltransferase 1 n=1 Tax=Actinia tenebrosa TaxID=6105 RepID=A0A6P8I5R7_ACTTE